MDERSDPVETPGPDERISKRASGAGRDRLRREAAVLGEHRQPGVVELVELIDTDDETVVVTRCVGGGSLADAGPMSVAEIAGVVAATAETVADLHRSGLVHGQLDPSHVLLAPNGRPVLCSFGQAGPPGTPLLDTVSADEPWLDPAARRGGERSPASDVYVLGAIVRALLERSRSSSTSRLSELVGAEARARRRLGRIAAAATRADPRLRPSARAMATALASAVSAPELPADAGRSTGDARPWRTRPTRPAPAERRRSGCAVAVVGVAGVAAVAGWWLTSRPAESPAPTPAARVSDPTPIPSPSPCEPGPDTVCADRVEIRSGVVDTGEVRFAVGDPGDLVVVGDWDCDGDATAALLRPATGEVFVFDRWARPGEDLAVRPVARLEGADAIDVVPVGPACHRLAVNYREGRWVYDSADA